MLWESRANLSLHMTSEIEGHVQRVDRQMFLYTELMYSLANTECYLVEPFSQVSQTASDLLILDP